MPQKDLNTTQYAILGLLALKPSWTAYELAEEMEHCFEYFWPRAQARVYAEAKALAARKLAHAEKRLVGRRPQTTYTLTPRGRRALAEWLDRPSRPVSLEFEGLLKIFFGRLGTRDQLLATMDHARADADYMLQVAAVVRRAYLECQAPFQAEHGHVRAFIYDFLVSYFAMYQDWVDRTRAELDRWRDLDPAGKGKRALAIFERNVPPAPRVTGSTPAMPGGYWHRVREVGEPPSSRRRRRNAT